MSWGRLFQVWGQYIFWFWFWFWTLLCFHRSLFGRPQAETLDQANQSGQEVPALRGEGCGGGPVQHRPEGGEPLHGQHPAHAARGYGRTDGHCWGDHHSRVLVQALLLSMFVRAKAWAMSTFSPCRFAVLEMVWECVCACVCVCGVCVCVCMCVCVYVCVCVVCIRVVCIRVVCVCVDEMNLKYDLHWHIHISVLSMLCHCRCIHTNTCILKPLKDSEPTGLKADIAKPCIYLHEINLVISGVLHWGTQQCFASFWNCIYRVQHVADNTVTAWAWRVQ